MKLNIAPRKTRLIAANKKREKEKKINKNLSTSIVCRCDLSSNIGWWQTEVSVWESRGNRVLNFSSAVRQSQNN